jgi:HAD superfamily hydrolase (TIGR01549 family)
MDMMPIRAVFFDLDDTLCDTTGSRPQRARRALDCLSAEYRHLDVDALVERALEVTGERLVFGVPALIEELGLAETPAGKQAIEAWFFGGCLELLEEHRDVSETLKLLAKDYVLGIITNGQEELQQAKFAHLLLEEHVPHVAISGTIGYEKPDVRIFAHALALAGVEPAEAVFVGDRLDVDIAGAKAAGMRAVWFNHWGGRLDSSPHLPDAMIERFSDLPAALEALSR